MLHPNQFQVNEAWIIFKLNDAPISTKADGGFNVFALMDAASCFILCSESIPVGSSEISKVEAELLLNNGHTHKQQLPKTLFIATDQPATHLSAATKVQGIKVARVPKDQLLLFVGEAQENFRERFC